MTDKPKKTGDTPIKKPLPTTRHPDPKRPLGPKKPKKGDSPTEEK